MGGFPGSGMIGEQLSLQINLVWALHSALLSTDESLAKDEAQTTVDPVNWSDDSQEEVCSILFSAAVVSFNCQYLVDNDMTAR